MEYPRFLSPYGAIDKSLHHLPHWEQEETCVFVTFRLADSLPVEKLAQWEEDRKVWLEAHPRPWTDAEAEEYGREFGARLDKWLDAGFGSCVLGEKENREIVWNAILHFDGTRYDVYAFVVMGNHVHVLFRPLNGHEMSAILHSWKSFTAKEINRRSNKDGQLWQHESWDRLVRNAVHFARVSRYIARNPGDSGVPVYIKKGFEDLLVV